MGFRFQWHNDEKKVMVLMAEGDWNWRDFHAAARAASFSTFQSKQPVDTLLDLRGSTRPAMPSGLRTHLRALGKKLAPALSGRAIIIGLPESAESELVLDDVRSFATTDGRAYLVKDEAALNALLVQWQEAADAEDL